MRPRRAGRDYFLLPSPPARPRRPSAPRGLGAGRDLDAPCRPPPPPRCSSRSGGVLAAVWHRGCRGSELQGKEGAGGLAEMRIDLRISPSGLASGGGGPPSEMIERERGGKEPAGIFLASAKDGCRSGEGGVCACVRSAVGPRLGGRAGSGDPGESGLPRGRAPCTTPAKSPRTPVLEPPSPAEGAGGRVLGMRRPEGREGNRRARLLPALQPPGDPRAAGRIPSGDDGARPRAACRCHPGEGRRKAQPPPRAPAPRGRLSPAAPHPSAHNPRTTLSSYACAPSAEGRPGSGGDEEPARCTSGSRAKNNCGVLVTAFPLAGRARRRLRIGALPQPVSRRGCGQRGAVPGSAGSCSRRG